MCRIYLLDVIDEPGEVVFEVKVFVTARKESQQGIDCTAA